VYDVGISDPWLKLHNTNLKIIDFKKSSLISAQQIKTSFLSSELHKAQKSPTFVELL